MAEGQRMTVTLITLLKRREGMSKADFTTYYEARHRLIGEKVLGGYATRYVRRFLHPTDGADQHEDADVILEIDFPDEATRDACFAAMGDEATMAEIVADEERLFDRSRIRTFTVEERESKLPPVTPQA
jgi:EthD domain